MNHAIDYVERRYSEPRLTRQQAEDQAAEDRQAQFDEAYEHHVNAACAAIQRTPYSLVTPKYIDSVLRSLSCKAMEAHLPELSEALAVFADDEVKA